MTLFTDTSNSDQSELFNATSESTLDTTKNYLTELVGEDKKFKTVDDLAKGKAEADAFIERLLREKREMEDKLKEKVILDDLVKRLENRTPPQNTPSSTERVDVENSPLTEQKVLELLEKQLQEKNKVSSQQQNLNYVRQELEKQYGPSFGSKIDQIRKELGVTVEQAEALAASSPKVFLQAFGNKSNPNPVVNPPPTSNTNIMSNGQVRNYEYYKELKKRDKNRFFSADVQNQMYKDRVALGDKF